MPVGFPGAPDGGAFYFFSSLLTHRDAIAMVDETDPSTGKRTAHATLLLRRWGTKWRGSGATSAVLGRRSAGADASEEGCWAEWEWRDGRLRFRNDRFGFHPVFRWDGSDRHGLSTSILELLRSGAPPDLDDDALAAFLRIGFFLGDDTPFASIRAMPPGTDVTAVPERLGWRWRTDVVPSAADLSPAEARRRFGELFQDAVERLPIGDHDKVGVPLSGGRDSRHIVLALARSGRLPDQCVTMRHHPPTGNEDAEIAARVAAEVGTRHVILDPPSRILVAELEKNLLTNLCASEHAWILPLGDHARREGLTVLLDGVAGDVLSESTFLSRERLELYQGGRLRELAELLLGGEGYLPSMLPAALYRRWNRDRAVRRVMAELERHVDAPNPVGQFYFWNRTRRQIALSPWGILARQSDVLGPFLDHRVYDFLAGLPASLLLDRTFHTETIREFYPELAHIPFETRQRDVLTTRSSVASLAWSAAAYFSSPDTDASYVRRSFLLPRFAKALVSREFGTRLRLLLPRPIYLAQLAALRDGLPGRDAAR